MNYFQQIIIPHPKKSRHIFTVAEDELLRRLVNEHGENNWGYIASLMKSRNARQCRERWRTYLRPSLNDGPWTQEEDEILLTKFMQYGTRWSLIGQFIPNRSDINIKNRWKALNGISCNQSVHSNSQSLVSYVSPISDPRFILLPNYAIQNQTKITHSISPPPDDISTFPNNSETRHNESPHVAFPSINTFSNINALPETNNSQESLMTFFNSISTSQLKNSPRVILTPLC